MGVSDVATYVGSHKFRGMMSARENRSPAPPGFVHSHLCNPRLARLLRNPTPSTDGGTRPIPAAKRRHVKARRASAGKPQMEQSESASADGTSFVTASGAVGFIPPRSRKSSSQAHMSAESGPRTVFVRLRAARLKARHSRPLTRWLILLNRPGLRRRGPRALLWERCAGFCPRVR